jgi:hypothetical protein
MKKTLTILLIFISSLSFGQNYKLFNSSSKKLFTDYPNPVNAYSIAFDTVTHSGTDSTYYNFFGLDNVNMFTSDTCYFWGPPTCYKQTVPSWIGRKILYDNVSKYQFFNLPGDTLTFDLTTNTSDTSIFYMDASQKFSFVFAKSDTLHLFGNIDSARFYKIIHRP